MAGQNFSYYRKSLPTWNRRYLPANGNGFAEPYERVHPWWGGRYSPWNPHNPYYDDRYDEDSPQARRARLIEALQRGASDTSNAPLGVGISRLAQGIIAGIMTHNDRKEREQRRQSWEAARRAASTGAANLADNIPETHVNKGPSSWNRPATGVDTDRTGRPSPKPGDSPRVDKSALGGNALNRQKKRPFQLQANQPGPGKGVWDV